MINFEKKIRLAAGPLPGVTLSGEQPPAARCAGAKMRRKYCENANNSRKKNFDVFDHFSFTISYTVQQLYILNTNL